MWIGALFPSPPSLCHGCHEPFLRLIEVTCLMLWTGRLYMTGPWWGSPSLSLFFPTCMPAGRIWEANSLSLHLPTPPPHMHNLGSHLSALVENPPLGMSTSNSFSGSLFIYLFIYFIFSEFCHTLKWNISLVAFKMNITWSTFRYY